MYDIKIETPAQRVVTIEATVNDLASLVLATRRGGRRTNAQLDLLEAFGDLLMTDRQVAAAVDDRRSELSSGEGGNGDDGQ